MLRPQVALSSRRLGACIGPRARAVRHSPLLKAAPALPTLARRPFSDLATPSVGDVGSNTTAPRDRTPESEAAPAFRKVFNADANKVIASVPNGKLRLRDACPCSLCVDPDSGQKTFSTADLDIDLTIRTSRLSGDGSLVILWENDKLSGNETHTSIYPSELLAQLQSTEVYRMVERVLWDRATMEAELDNCRISYDDWLAGGDKFVDAFANLHRTGLIFVHGVPESETSVEEIGQQIGRLQDTFYGLTWDVVSKPKAENVAYTSKFLCLHQDLLYNVPTPRIQLLHCISNSCDGGESLFSDGVRAANQVRLQHPSHFRTLAKEHVAYHYEKNGHYYKGSHSTIRERKDGLVGSVWWSPPFQDVFPPGTRMQNWIKAAKHFRAALESPENMFEYRMRPGECVVFDNRRVLHGRQQFTTSEGKRWLKGTYVSDQVFRGKTVQMMDRLEGRWKLPSIETAGAAEVQALKAQLEGAP